MNSGTTNRPEAQAQVWRLHWRDDSWTTPDGAWRHGIAGQRPDIAQAHEAVDAWAAETGIAGRLPHVGPWSVWWTLRFCLVHEQLSLMLPHLRALRDIHATTPLRVDRIELSPDAPAWWRSLPGCVDISAPVQQAAPPRDFRRNAARVFKALVGEYRLRRLLARSPQGKRVLAISRANAWNGAMDRELHTVLLELERQGYEVIVMEQSHGPLAAQLSGWRTRPKEHLLGDLLHLRYRRSARPAPPAFDIPDAPLIIDGVDLAPVARAYIQENAVSHFHQHNTYLATLPPLLRQLGIGAVLLSDENGAEHGVKLAALHAGLPVIAVQHGCIHEDHLSYRFPQATRPEAIPLATQTCVYGSHELALLSNDSIYPASAVSVTGQVANDTRPLGLRAWGLRGEKGEALRSAVLPPGASKLLLLTSQDLLHDTAARVLLPALQDADDSLFLVVRPHPRERGGHWERYAQQSGLAGRMCVQREGALEDWLDACDYHVSVSSTALSEAIVWGRPNILLGLDSAGDWLGVHRADLALSLEDFPNLGQCIEAWEQKNFTALDQDRLRYIEEHFHKLDGQAGQRTANVLRCYFS